MSRPAERKGYPFRYTAARTMAARIDHLRLEAEALAEYPGQHSLAASYVRDVPRIRKAVGYEPRDHLEACRISVKTVPGALIGRSADGPIGSSLATWRSWPLRAMWYSAP
jgi:hypothetical protein